MASLISIIIPFYNRFEYLRETLKSIKAQTYPNFEVLIVDDHSSEFTNSSLKKFLGRLDDPRFKLLVNKGKKGAGGSRNTGLFSAQGKYVIFLDSDDLLAPFCIEKRIETMGDSNFDFAVFPMLLFFDSIKDSNYLWNTETAEPDLDRFLKLDSVWQTTGPIWSRDFLIKLGGFDEGLNCWQDVDIHIRALLAKPKYKKFYNTDPDCYYRKNSKESISQQGLNSFEKLRSRFAFIQKLEQLEIRKRELRYIGANLLISILFSGNFKFFREVYYWIKDKPILNFNEKMRILKLALIIPTRLYRIKPFLWYRNKLTDKMIPKNQIGRVLVK